MQRLLYILFAVLILGSCTKPKQTPESSVLDIISNAQYGDTHACSNWANRFWEVFGTPQSPDFSALTMRVDVETYDSIKGVIENEFGPFKYSFLTLPKELIADSGFYWHLSKTSCDKVYYWVNDSLSIAWSLFDVEDNIGYAYLDISKHTTKKK